MAHMAHTCALVARAVRPGSVCAGTHGTRLPGCPAAAACRLPIAGCRLPIAGVAGPSADGHGYGAFANNFYFL